MWDNNEKMKDLESRQQGLGDVMLQIRISLNPLLVNLENILVWPISVDIDMATLLKTPHTCAATVRKIISMY